MTGLLLAATGCLTPWPVKVISSWLPGLVHVNGVPTRIKLIDSAGQVDLPHHARVSLPGPFPSQLSFCLLWQEEFGHLRSLCYAHVDVFILCFSLANPVSFQNIASKWIPQIRAGNRTSPIILVGTQSDLCQNVDILIHLAQRGTKPVAHSQARRLARRIRAGDYLECSALTQHNLKDVFDSAVSAAIKHKELGKSCKKLSMIKRLKAFWEGKLRLLWNWNSACLEIFYEALSTEQFLQSISVLLFAGNVLEIPPPSLLPLVLCFFYVFLYFYVCSVLLINAPLCNTINDSSFSFYPCFLFNILGNKLCEKWKLTVSVENWRENTETNGHLLLLWRTHLQHKSYLNPASAL